MSESDHINLNSDAVSVGGDLAATLKNGDDDCANRVENGLNETKIDLIAEKEAVNKGCPVDELAGQQHEKEDVTMTSEIVNVDESARQVNPSMEVDSVEGEIQAGEVDINETQVNGLNGMGIDLLAEKEVVNGGCSVDGGVKLAGEQHEEEDVTMLDWEIVNVDQSARQVNPSTEVDSVEGQIQAVEVDSETEINETQVNGLNGTKIDLLAEKAVNGGCSVYGGVKLAGQQHREENVTMPDLENVNIGESARQVNPSTEVDSVEGEIQAVEVNLETEINETQVDGLNGTKNDLLAKEVNLLEKEAVVGVMKLAGQQHKEEDVTMPDSENVNIDESARQVNPSMEVDSVEGENQAVEVDSETEINETQIEVTVNDENGARVSEESGDDHDSMDSDMPDSENVNIDESARQVNPSAEADSVEGENPTVEVDSETELNETQAKVLEEFSDIDSSSMDSDRNEQGIVSLKSTVSNPEFHFRDLVWGKIRSHPWWPGQILNPSTASNKAKKYFKKDSHLIAYFGDDTFSWNPMSKIKAFQPNFSQLEKQSNLGEFHNAIVCALKEVSRGIELTLACPCIPEDVYAEIESQIKEEAYGGDNFSCASSFEPLKPVGFVKTLAQQPLGDVDRLEFSTARAQLLAFYRWKGYSQLPQLQFLGGLLECDANIPLLKNDKQVSSQDEKSKSQGASSNKRKQTSDDSLNVGEKEESLSEWIVKNRRSGMSIGKEGSDNKSADKLISSFSGKKRKMVDSVTDNKAEVHFSPNAAVKSSQIKGTFGVGNIILKVASKLNGSSPVLKDTAKKSGKSGSTKKLSDA